MEKEELSKMLKENGESKPIVKQEGDKLPQYICAIIGECFIYLFIFYRQARQLFNLFNKCLDVHLFHGLFSSV